METDTADDDHSVTIYQDLESEEDVACEQGEQNVNKNKRPAAKPRGRPKKKTYDPRPRQPIMENPDNTVEARNTGERENGL